MCLLKRVKSTIEQNKIANLATDIIDAKKANPNADTASIENKIDALLYKLFNLTAAERFIVEEAIK